MNARRALFVSLAVGVTACSSPPRLDGGADAPAELARDVPAIDAGSDVGQDAGFDARLDEQRPPEDVAADAFV